MGPTGQRKTYPESRRVRQVFLRRLSFPKHSYSNRIRSILNAHMAEGTFYYATDIHAILSRHLGEPVTVR